MVEHLDWDGAKGFIINPHGDVLIARRALSSIHHPRMPRPGEHDLPGGRRKKKRDSSPEETFKREAREEIGRQVSILDLMGVVTGPQPSKPHRLRTIWVFVAKLCDFDPRDPRPDLVPDPREHSHLSWLAAGNIPDTSLPDKYKALYLANLVSVSLLCQNLVELASPDLN